MAEHSGRGGVLRRRDHGAPAFVGRRVIVVGGGNSAGQGAMYLARYAKEVQIVVRRDSLRDTMSQYLIDQIEKTPNIRLAAADGNRTSRGRGSRGTGRADFARRWIAQRGGSRRAVCVYRHPSAKRLAACRRAARRQGIRPHGPGPDGGRSVSRASGRSRANRCRSRPACPGSSPPATSAPAR